MFIVPDRLLLYVSCSKCSAVAACFVSKHLQKRTKSHRTKHIFRELKFTQQTKLIEASRNGENSNSQKTRRRQRERRRRGQMQRQRNRKAKSKANAKAKGESKSKATAAAATPRTTKEKTNEESTIFQKIAISRVWTRHSPLSKLYPSKLMVVTLTLTSLMLT